MKQFDYLFFEAFLFYGNAKSLMEITERYSVDELSFSEKDTNRILDLTTQFLTNFYKKTDFGNIEDVGVKKLLTNEFFQNKIRRWFSNLFLILASIRFSDEKGKDLIKPLKSFLAQEKFLYWDNYVYLASFLSQHHSLFTTTDIEELLTTFRDSKSFNIGASRILEALDSIMEQNKALPKIDNRKLILSVLDKVEKDNAMYLVFLWKMSSAQLREIIAKKIEYFLEGDLHLDLYSSIIRNQIIDYKKYWSKYLAYFTRIKELPIYIRNEEVFSENYEFINFIYLLYQQGMIPIAQEQLEAVSDLPAYIQFFLNPYHFDYSLFNPYWLKLVKGEVFSKIFETIPALCEATTKKIHL